MKSKRVSNAAYADKLNRFPHSDSLACLGKASRAADTHSCLLQLSAALERVRAGADVMPKSQLHKVLAAELGPGWRSKVADFEDEPLAAASIGQVTHRPPPSGQASLIARQDRHRFCWRSCWCRRPILGAKTCMPWQPARCMVLLNL